MAKITIVYHSGYGHTKRQAEAVQAGAAKVSGVQVESLAIDAEGNLPDGGWDKLAAADAIVFGSPTYMGSVSWQFKKFADASSKPWYGQAWKDKIAGGFTNSATINGDKLSTLHYLFTLAMQHSMVWVGTGMLPSNDSKAHRDSPNWLGSFAGPMAQSPADVGPDQSPAKGDLDTAQQFGQRIAEAALRWKKK